MERLADELDLVQRNIELETAALVETIVSRVRHGTGSVSCIECGDEIPAARRDKVPNAQRCLYCQERFEGVGLVALQRST